VTYLSLPTVGSMTLDVGNFLTANPMLVHEVAGHALAHALYSYSRQRGRGRGMSRRQMRKSSNRKRRWFVDNIIMHHRRLHDRNREIVISNVRARVEARKKLEKKKLEKSQNSLARGPSPSHQTRVRNVVNLKERAAELRGSVDARKTRARQRWISLMQEKGKI
jgi:hypothetical protein